MALRGQLCPDTLGRLYRPLFLLLHKALFPFPPLFPNIPTKSGTVFSMSNKLPVLLLTLLHLHLFICAVHIFCWILFILAMSFNVHFFCPGSFT